MSETVIATCPTCNGRKYVEGRMCTTCDGDGVKWRKVEEGADQPEAHLDLTYQPER